MFLTQILAQAIAGITTTFLFPQPTERSRQKSFRQNIITPFQGVLHRLFMKPAAMPHEVGCDD